MGILAARWFLSVSNKEAGLQFAAATSLQSSITDEIWKEKVIKEAKTIMFEAVICFL